ncbi:MAG: glycosyltransferase family 39 protein, partial [Elusimicrobia bacterium]|nr:glycosyltransferase family 39 protein [Elusimicrobiota bacterium]
MRLRRHLLFLSVLALAAWARFHGLGVRGLWLDEAYSAHLAHCGWTGLIRELSRESTPPFYYLILHGWTSVLGEGEAALRLLSALFSLGGIGALYVLVRKHFSAGSAELAAVLIAFSPLHVYYAQEARMYALLALLGTVLVDAAMDYVQKRGARALLVAGVSGTLMLYTHTIALWLVAGCALAVCASARDRKTRLGWLAMVLATVLAYSPWAAVLAAQLARQRTVLEWFNPLWESKPVAGHVVDALASMSFGPFPGYVAIRGGKLGGVVSLLGMVALAAYGLLRARDSVAARLAGLAGVSVLGLGIAYSVLVQPVFIPGRT